MLHLYSYLFKLHALPLEFYKSNMYEVLFCLFKIFYSIYRIIHRTYKNKTFEKH